MPRLETFRAKVGATILDVMRPGWAGEIDAATLNLANCEACVLGQLFGNYWRGAEQVFAMNKSTGGTDALEDAAARAGFQVDRVVVDGKREPLYSDLTTAWRREIAKRTATRKRGR